MAFIEWMKTNWVGLTFVVSLSFNLASGVAALTATKKDDNMIAKIKTFVGRFLSLK